MALETRKITPIERIDEGMQAYFSKIYAYMAGALGVSAVSAYFSAKDPILSLLYTVTEKGLTPSLLGILTMIAPLAIVFFISMGKFSLSNTKLLFWGFSVLMGISLSSILLTYTAGSVFQIFLVTACSFLGMSLYARSTQRDFSAWGSFLTMGVIGLIVTMVINLFLKSNFLTMAGSLVSVVIFAGLTIYETQRLKYMYSAAFSAEEREAVALRGALSLYISFINLFVSLLNLAGDRR